MIMMWLYAIFVDASCAGQMGLLYVVCRAAYKRLYHQPKLLLSLVTVPNYAIVLFYAIGVLRKAFA
jgi:hypothetical protein